MRIEIPQLGRVLELGAILKPISLLSVLAANKVPVAHSCGGDGVCGTCWIEIEGQGLPEKSAHSKKLWNKQFPQVTQKKSQYFACLVEISEKDSSKTWVIRCPSW